MEDKVDKLDDEEFRAWMEKKTKRRSCTGDEWNLPDPEYCKENEICYKMDIKLGKE